MHDLRKFAERDSAGLEEMIGYRNNAGRAFTESVADMLSQVILHGSYHRRQLALLTRQGGGTPAPTDYILFARTQGGRR